MLPCENCFGRGCAFEISVCKHLINLTKSNDKTQLTQIPSIWSESFLKIGVLDNCCCYCQQHNNQSNTSGDNWHNQLLQVILQSSFCAQHICGMLPNAQVFAIMEMGLLSVVTANQSKQVGYLGFIAFFAI